MKIKTWGERCEEHPAHDGIVTEDMIRERMQEEIDELRAEVERLTTVSYDLLGELTACRAAQQMIKRSKL